MQSRETQKTMVKWTNAGGQTKRANERSFVYRPPAWRRWRNVKTTSDFRSISSSSALDKQFLFFIGATLCFIKSKFLGLILGKVSNFALVIQLNLPTDKFRIIILLFKFHSYTTHYRLKNLMASAYRTIATVLSTCWMHGVEFVVMKRLYLLWPSGSSKPLLFSRKHRKCLHLRVHFLVRFCAIMVAISLKIRSLKGLLALIPLPE